MAELLLKVGPGANYADGDVLCAFNHRRIRCVHAQHLCHVDKAGTNRDGLRPVGSLTREFLEATCEYRIDRVSQHEIRRTNLWTGSVVVVGSTPVEDPDKPGKMMHMHVEEYFRRRVRHRRHRIFGTRGREFRFGGQKRSDDATLDRVWTAIEQHSPRRQDEDEFLGWPMGRLDIRHHLAVKVVDMTDEDVQRFESPRLQLDSNGDAVLDENSSPVVLAKRNQSIAWRDLLGDLQETDTRVLDVGISVGRELPAYEARYRSKVQPEQPLTRLARKGDEPRTR